MEVLPKKPSDILVRTSAILIALPLTIAPIYFGYSAYVGLFLLIGAFYEWSKICQVPLALGAFFLLSCILVVKLPTFFTLSFFSLLFAFLTSRYKIWFLLGGLYGFGGIYGFLAVFHEKPFELLQVLGFIWLGDISAYLTGRLLKGPKLAPSISPGKTWSGLIGGIVIPVSLFAWFFKVFHHPLNTQVVLILSAISLMAHLGDLLESKMKRHFGIKDSGSIFPGHGGFLDRLDSVFLVGWALMFLQYILK